MLGRPEERREAGAGVEAREAAPVDRAVAADERRRLQVADERVVLDPRHRADRRRGAVRSRLGAGRPRPRQRLGGREHARRAPRARLRAGEEAHAASGERRLERLEALDQRVERSGSASTTSVGSLASPHRRQASPSRTSSEITSPSTKRISYVPSTAASGRNRMWTAYVLQQSPAAGEPIVRAPQCASEPEHVVERAPVRRQLVDRHGRGRRQLRPRTTPAPSRWRSRPARMFVPIPGSASARSV